MVSFSPTLATVSLAFRSRAPPVASSFRRVCRVAVGSGEDRSRLDLALLAALKQSGVENAGCLVKTESLAAVAVEWRYSEAR